MTYQLFHADWSALSPPRRSPARRMGSKMNRMRSAPSLEQRSSFMLCWRLVLDGVDHGAAQRRTFVLEHVDAGVDRAGLFVGEALVPGVELVGAHHLPHTTV
ncbi:MAG: hypothetical protein QOF30_3455 [Acidimicrobiaceae bacterium]|nr:hypothetical protein [Acidimicrobiaceae bacterium]